MQQDLSKIANELRKETCPRRVLDEVERRISQKQSAPNRLRWALCAVVGAVLLGCLSVWLSQGDKNSSPQAALVEQRFQVANQAQDALALVGSELLAAGAHSEKIISDRAVPPLRNSIEITKNKIINPIEL